MSNFCRFLRFLRILTNWPIYIYIYILIYAVIETGKRFHKDVAECKFSGGVAEYRKLPVFPLLGDTLRTRFQQDMPAITLMHRAITQKMQEFITTHSSGSLYIHGPQGVGKSYSLYEVLTSLLVVPCSNNPHLCCQHVFYSSLILSLLYPFN
jgi:hypothetical protein